MVRLASSLSPLRAIPARRGTGPLSGVEGIKTGAIPTPEGGDTRAWLMWAKNSLGSSLLCRDHWDGAAGHDRLV